MPQEYKVVMNGIWGFVVRDLTFSVTFTHICHHPLFQSDYAVVKSLCTTVNNERFWKAFEVSSDC